MSHKSCLAENLHDVTTTNHAATPQLTASPWYEDFGWLGSLVISLLEVIPLYHRRPR